MNGYDFRIEENYLGVIRHDPRVVNFGRSIVLRECIWSLNKNPLQIYYPCWINHFIGCDIRKFEKTLMQLQMLCGGLPTNKF
jgi:hypothetical protein